MRGKKKLTSLRTANDIMALQDGGEDVSLDGCSLSVPAKLDVLDHDWVETSVWELPRTSAADQDRKKTFLTFFTGWILIGPSKVTSISTTLLLLATPFGSVPLKMTYFWNRTPERVPDPS